METVHKTRIETPAPAAGGKGVPLFFTAADCGSVVCSLIVAPPCAAVQDSIQKT
jgi:hypothetical protein